MATYNAGSVYTLTGTPEEIAAKVEEIPFIFNTGYVYSGTAGSVTVFIEAVIDN